ncbi:CPBP family intramembrane glutamic endopeptidase [Corallococcus sp. Z5C101001]|uniref:CPBP family intramembrane glutamic endopeptidase n=1 Tax=Corallococcus sp. Z5C101001 TaxID=2596829 RepID=UPI00210693A0|nr:type II CAAX endopeptidase family protein [Corallococcus sp. Z5C101001]
MSVSSVAPPAPEGAAQTAWRAVAIGGVLAWTALVHAHPPRFFTVASAFCALWLAVTWRAMGPWRRPPPALSLPDAAWGGAQGVLLYVGARAFLWAFCGGFTDALCEPLHAVYSTFGTGSPGMALALVLLLVPAEELFWRGWVQGALRPRLGRWGAVAGSAVASSLVLLGFGEPLLALAALPTSLAWGALAEWRRTPLASWLSHALWDVLIVVVWPAT